MHSIDAQMNMNQVSLYEIQCFVAVAEELNFSRAAMRLHMSQPPLSRQVQSLESKLGVKLLQRSTRAVSLTSAGALYLQDVRHILTRLDCAAASAQRAAGGEASRLRLAFVGALLDEGLVEVLQALRKHHSQCQIHLTDLPPAAQLDALLGGQVDGAFIGAEPVKLAKRLSLVVWKVEPLLLALPQNHALAARGSIHLSQLKHENWVMVSRAAAPAFRHQFDRLSAAANIRPRVVQESERAAAVLTMVAAEQGVSLLSESLSRLVHPGVVFRAIGGKPVPLTHTFAYRTQETNPILLDFVSLLAHAADRKLTTPQKG
jgi:DNA-binding transcriptional LysR family regulator